MPKYLSRKKLMPVVAAAAVALVGTSLAFADTGTSMAVTSPLQPVPTSAEAALSPSYSYPSNALFVATNGNDNNAGTSGSPFRTITAATSKAPSGSTIVVRGGTYRDGSSSPIWKNLTIQNYPGEQVWMDGADVVSSWSASGGQWATSWSTPTFCADAYYSRGYLSQASDNSGPCTHRDMAQDSRNPAAGDPQMAYVNGNALKEVTSRAAVDESSFFYDQSSRQLFIGTNPSGKTVELSARPTALFPEGGNGFAIKGIGFKRFASNEWNGNKTHGALVINNPNSTLDHIAVVQSAGAGISFANTRNAVVTNSYISNNGFNGLDANGSISSGGVDNMRIEYNMFDGNNTELFGTGCSLSCAAAGSKMAHMNGFTLRGNIFQNAKGNGKGYWCDVSCANGVMVANVFRNNGDTGLFYEISNTGTIASNLIYNNGGYGLKMGSANTAIYNNTIVNNGINVLLYDDDRGPGINYDGILGGPSTTNITFHNNVVGGGGSPEVQLWRTSSSGGNTGPSSFMVGMDYNTYFRPNGSPATLMEWRDGNSVGLRSTAEVAAAHNGFESHSVDTTTNPFVDSANGNFTLKSSGAARAIPANIASAIGIAQQATPQGALLYPGSSGTRVPTTTGKPATTTTAKPATTTTTKPTPTTVRPPSTTLPSVPVTTTKPSPSGIVVAPANGTVVAGTVVLTATPSVNGITRGELFLGSQQVKPYVDRGVYYYMIGAGNLADGTPVRVTWKLYDASGRSYVSETRLVADNSKAADIDLNGLHDGSVLSGSKYRLTATAPRATSAQLLFGAVPALQHNGSGPYVFDLNTRPVASGSTVLVTWVVTDANGVVTGKRAVVSIHN